MKVVVIGATGTIGGAVADALEARHEVVRASRSGTVKVDLDDPGSIDKLFASTPEVDAVVCCAANAELASFASLSDSEFARIVSSKLFGQVALARRAVDHLRDGGSVTVTAGTFEEPLAGSSAGALVNAGLEGFVCALAVELERGLRVNVVSPGWVKDAAKAAVVARAYVAAVEGTSQGRTIRPSAAGSSVSHT